MTSKAVIDAPRKIDDRSQYCSLPLTCDQRQFCNTDNVVEQIFFGTAEHPRLTQREKEILQLIISGRTNKEIARQLCRVERTVEYHRNHLMHKLSAHNTAELLKKAISMGVVSL